MLEVENIHSYYGNIHALKGVSLTVEKGEIVTLIGGNGAGKSTTLRSITGIMKPLEGFVRLEGENLALFKPHEIVYKGIAMVPEGRRVFGRLTVAENLDMGAYTRPSKQETEADLDRVFKLFPRLKERRTQVAGTLSGGEQQMLATGRALMARPRILLMDEPFGALDPLSRVDLQKEFKQLQQRLGKTVVFVTHDVGEALLLGDRIALMEEGRLLSLQSPREFATSQDPRTKSYLEAFRAGHHLLEGEAR